MQRIAVVGLVVGLALAGCGRPGGGVTLGPPPEPVLATRAPRPVTARPRPAPQRPAAPRHVPQTAPDSWTPRGGVQPGAWKAIVVHHSASPKATPSSMHNYHLEQRGWCNGLGYHFVIGNGVNYPDGQVYVGSRWKKQIAGAHCKSKGGRYFGAWRPANYFNEHAIGICLIGNFQNERPTSKQLAALASLAGFLCQQNGISPDHVYGHGEVTHKTLCPGQHVNMNTVRRSARTVLVRGAPGQPAAGAVGR